MKVHTFVSKVSVEALRQTDDVINDWLAQHQVAPRFIVQTVGCEGERHGHGQDPVLITSVWYE